MGGKDIRSRLGDAYAEALWKVHKHLNASADFVMYWWDRAAEQLMRKESKLRRFGFVTTNSITQEFSRRVIKKRMEDKPPVSLLMAIPDHPWTKAGRDAAAVRIAMTVVTRGQNDGSLREVVSESGLDTDEPLVRFRDLIGKINADLSVGTDVIAAVPLKSNDELCSPGVKLHGAGFIITPREAERLGLGRREGLEWHIRPYVNGRDVAQHSRKALVIDLYPLTSDAVRAQYSEVYQHVLDKVKPDRDTNNMLFRREHWWWFGATHEMYRSFKRALLATS